MLYCAMDTHASGRSLRVLEKLPPFPEGWYFLTDRKTLEEKKLIERKWMGEEIVAWSDEEGRVCVADAYCPHLGSHMGPTVGGVVRDGCLVCPFHGFTFDTTGRCVAVPHAPAPKAARLRVYETHEILGMIFAWWGSGGREPQWNLPEEPPTGSDWSNLGFTRLRFRGHPQETTENSVDLEHLDYTHGYYDVEPTAPLAIDGAYLKSCFDFKNVRRFAGLVDIVSEVSAVTHVHGLGFSFVEIREKTVGMSARMWVLATPVADTRLEMTLVTQVREIRRPGRFFVGLGFLPVPLRHRLMSRFFLSEERRFVLQDVVIWNRKRYCVPPRLSRADGPIGRYRLYCRQFYPELRSRAEPTRRLGLVGVAGRPAGEGRG
ncbi:MAG: Rieske (2Fe-2S) protein [Gemmatimonadetes bacterium]|nr:Rieske (2Fe-2S) protein [Gemmatimonadota bacterium]MYE17019.1 Rieske (2Fe-2S) protein [Gemmatimonadota bacterium]MYG21303.1 Rieske (2Fe-2S) protein [Gemmatimonadota bacterium]MYJ39318.1 Rieske (2Fe-2S) protein [Gemmatimonadota bacterium]